MESGGSRGRRSCEEDPDSAIGKKRQKMISGEEDEKKDFSKQAVQFVDHLMASYALTCKELIGAALRLLSDMKILLTSTTAQPYSNWTSELHSTVKNLDGDAKEFFLLFTEPRDDEITKMNEVVFQNLLDDPVETDCKDSEEEKPKPLHGRKDVPEKNSKSCNEGKSEVHARKPDVQNETEKPNDAESNDDCQEEGSDPFEYLFDEEEEKPLNTPEVKQEESDCKAIVEYPCEGDDGSSSYESEERSDSEIDFIPLTRKKD